MPWLFGIFSHSNGSFGLFAVLPFGGPNAFDILPNAPDRLTLMCVKPQHFVKTTAAPAAVTTITTKGGRESVAGEGVGGESGDNNKKNSGLFLTFE